jgi:hypothetical protein
MSENQNDRDKQIEEFVKKNFGDSEIQEMVIFLKKGEMPAFAKGLADSGLNALAFVFKVQEKNIKKIEALGANPEDYQQISLLMKAEDVGIFFKIIKDSKLTTSFSPEAKKFADFYDENDPSGGVLH